MFLCNADCPGIDILNKSFSYMFFSDWNSDDPKLERAHMDGSKRFVLVDTQIQLVNGITVDFVLQRVYWADAHFDYIETIDYFGKDRYGISHCLLHLKHYDVISVFN